MSVRGEGPGPEEVVSEGDPEEDAAAVRQRLKFWGVAGAGVGVAAGLLIAPTAGRQAAAYGLPLSAQNWIALGVYVASPLTAGGAAAVIGYLTARTKKP